MMAEHATQYSLQISDWSNNGVDDDDGRDDEDIVMGGMIIIVLDRSIIQWKFSFCLKLWW